MVARRETVQQKRSLSSPSLPVSAPFDWWNLLLRRRATDWPRDDDETRHFFSVAPTVKFGERLEVFAGIQLLRGGGPENDLVMTGVALLI